MAYKINCKKHEIKNLHKIAAKLYQFAFLNSKIFFIQNDSLFSYQIADNSISNMKLAAEFLFTINGHLFVINRNILSIYRDSKTFLDPLNIVFQPNPLKIVQLQNFLFFLYDDCISYYESRKEIPNPGFKKGKIINNLKKVNLRIDHVGLLGQEIVYLKEGRVYKTNRLILEAEGDNFVGDSACIKVNSYVSVKRTLLYAFEEEIEDMVVIGDNLIVLQKENEWCIRKFKIKEDCLEEKYSLKVERETKITVLGDFLSVHESLIDVRGAPVKVLDEFIAAAEGNVFLGINKLYFISDFNQDKNYLIGESMKNFTISLGSFPSEKATVIDENSIKVPEILKTEEERNAFIKFMTKIKVWEAISTEINSKKLERNNLYEEVKKMKGEIDNQMQEIKDKSEKIKAKVNELKEKSCLIKIDPQDFFVKTKELKHKIKRISQKNIKQYYRKLKMQNEVFKDLFTKY
ncbi:hypothetical protein NUSPORA_01028 [Nucleospora cyclopteri]